MSLYQKQKAEEEGRGTKLNIENMTSAYVYQVHNSNNSYPYVLNESTYSGEKSRFWIFHLDNTPYFCKAIMTVGFFGHC